MDWSLQDWSQLADLSFTQFLPQVSMQFQRNSFSYKGTSSANKQILLWIVYTMYIYLFVYSFIYLTLYSVYISESHDLAFNIPKSYLGF